MTLLLNEHYWTDQAISHSIHFKMMHVGNIPKKMAHFQNMSCLFSKAHIQYLDEWIKELQYT